MLINIISVLCWGAIVEISNNLLPENKFDISAVNSLMGLPDEEVIPILPELLTWIQDINWPIAIPMLSVLKKFEKHLQPYILNILQPEETDDVWKYWIISKLLPLFSNEKLKVYKKSIERISKYPTHGEKKEEVDIVATSFLAQSYFNS